MTPTRGLDAPTRERMVPMTRERRTPMARDERSLARVWFNKGALPKLGSTSNPQNQNFGINYNVSTELQGLSLARALNFFYRIAPLPCHTVCMPTERRYHFGVLPIRDGLSANVSCLVRSSIEVPPPFQVLHSDSSPPFRLLLFCCTQSFYFTFPHPTPNCKPWQPSQNLPSLPCVACRLQRSGTNAKLPLSQATSSLPGPPAGRPS